MMQMKALLQSEGFYKALTFLGAIGVFGTCIMGWGGTDFIIELAVKKMMRLVPGSTIWEVWKTIPIPVYIKFNLFNITNPEEIATGAKPRVTEMGPYVYLVDFEKYDFGKNATRDTVLYSPSRTYTFQKGMSAGKEDDLVTYINLIFVAVSHIANGFTDLDVILETVDGMLSEKGEKLTRTDKVRDLLFDGVSIQNFVDLINDPLVQQAGSVELPESYKDGLFALFKGKNGTKDGRWECHTGIRDSAEIGKLYGYNGKTKLDIYKNDSCNAINGTDGTLNPPFIVPGETELYVFIPELCRSIRWEFVKMSELNGVPVARHRFPDIQSVPENPDLWCFCPLEDPMECNVHGFANLAPCFEGAPLLYSKPHFLNVPKPIRNLVEGLRPNPFLHESQLDLHPLTGAAINASIKMQFSIELVPWEAMPSFAKVSRAFVPLVWVELLAALTGVQLVMIQLLAFFLKVWPYLRWLTLVCSFGLVFLGMFFVYRLRKQNMITSVEDDDDDVVTTNAEHEIWMKKFKKNDAVEDIT